MFTVTKPSTDHKFNLIYKLQSKGKALYQLYEGLQDQFVDDIILYQETYARQRQVIDILTLLEEPIRFPQLIDRCNVGVEV